MKSSGGEGNGTPLQDSCLENPMEGGAWWATVHGVTKLELIYNFSNIEKTKQKIHTKTYINPDRQRSHSFPPEI